MTTYKKLKNIRNCILVNAGMVMNYTQWEDKQCLNLLRSILTNKEANKDYFDIDPYELHEDEAHDLGFSLWDEESSLYLLPIWVAPFIKDGIVLESINGEPVTYKKGETDIDTRFGMLAYGVRLKTKETNKND